jgi:uncharacterized protein YndB with AHSA1/START domain
MTSAVSHGHYVIERHYPVSAERVFAAFADASRKRRWFVEGEGTIVDEHQLDFRVGGTEKTLVRFPQGGSMSNESYYHDIVPNERIVLSYAMTFMGKRISASLATFEIRPDRAGTKLVFTDQIAFFEGADGLKMREDGWRQLLERLAQELGRAPQ